MYTQQSAITHGKGKVWLAEIPVPEPDEYQCLCKIMACATCSGTDQKIIEKKLSASLRYPGILGHESIGKTVKIGKKVRNIKEGDVFLRPTAVYQGEKLSEYHSLFGGFAEYGLITDIQALKQDHPEETPPNYTIYQQKIPSDISISYNDATMLITMKEIASYLANVGITFNSSLVILGSGSVAMNMCFFAKLIGAYPVIMIGRRDESLENCKKVGADFIINNKKEDIVAKVKEITEGERVNFVLDAAGDSKLITESGQLLKTHGKIVSYASHHSTIFSIDRSKGRSRWSFVFDGPSEEKAHQYLLDLTKLNAIPFKLFYSHTMPFDSIEQGFDLLKNKKACKIVFEMEQKK